MGHRTVTPRQMKTSLADLSCTLILQNRADFTIGDLERLVASNVGIHDSPAELLDACHATGLITAQDRGTYRFAHQALREYLAASRVADHVSVATPLLRACHTDPHAQNVWSLSCATTTDASDLLGTALRLEGPQRLERAAILAWALGQQITASRDVINQCSDYIATQLEAELANARIVLVGTEGTSEEEQDHAGPDKAVVWRAALHLPTEGNDAERDGVLEHLLVAVHNTRSGSGAELVKNRLERSSAPAVRLLATLQTVEGDCTARVQRNTHTLLISFIVLDPTKLLATELNAARAAAYAPLGDSHAFSDDRGSSSLGTTHDLFSELHETLVTRLGLQAAPIQRPLPMPKDAPAPSPMVVQVGSGVHVDLSHSQALQQPSPEVGHALPPDTAAFTGRSEELSQVTATAASAGGVAAVCAIDGMPGSGKTALAVHAAHMLRDRFPDRQVFINLHAHTPGRKPVLPEDALAGLLAAVGVDPRFLPADLDGRAAMWRDRTAGQRSLLILDNAVSSSQVAPLLPGDAGSLVLVTSRRRLADLPGAVVPLHLEALPPDQASAMFLRLAPRGAAEPIAAVHEVVQLAGQLPLAISLLARVYARHLSWTLADLISETQASMLTQAAERDSVASAIELSYRYLTPDQQQFFRRLGLHPGTSIDTYAAAALAGIPLHEAARYLDALDSEGLLAEVAPRRYSMHNLIRRFAEDLASSDSAADREHALERLFNYYQYTAALADARLTRQSRTTPTPAVDTPPPATLPELADRTKALAWARTERANLLACLDQATLTRQHARIVSLAAAMTEILRLDGPWTDAISRHSTAIQSARHLGDQPGEADALRSLGTVRRLTGDFLGASESHAAALAISRDLGDQPGQANALTNLGSLRCLTGDYPEAAQALEQALAISRDLGDQPGQANALTNLGSLRFLTGDYPEAAQALEQALAISRDLGDRLGQANALTNLGTVRRMTGDYPAAAEALEEALAISRDLGDRLGHANALTNLGALRQLTGDYPSAVEALAAALAMSRDLGDRLGQEHALIILGTVRRMTGDYPAAAEALEEALAISRDLGDLGGEAEALNGAGTVYRIRGDLALAEAYHRQALDLALKIASPLDEAHARAGLGRNALAAGRLAEAERLLRQAREIFLRIGAAEAPAVAAELDSLTGA